MADHTICRGNESYCLAVRPAYWPGCPHVGELVGQAGSRRATHFTLAALNRAGSRLQAADCWLLVGLARGTPKHPECPLRLFEGSGCEQSRLVGRARVAGRAGWSSWHDRLVELAGGAGTICWSASAQRASPATWLSETPKLVSW